MADKEVDVLIVGGGLTGAALSLALKESGWSTLLLDAQDFSAEGCADFDARTLALSPASIRILEQLQAWDKLVKNATPIHTIHVSNQGRFGKALLRNKPTQPLGYVVEMHHIQRIFYQLLAEQALLAPAKLQAFDPTNNLATAQCHTKKISIKARIVVAADGANSSVRRLCGLTAAVRDYHQHGLVANIGLARDHHHYAYERFTQSGPLALLPMNHHRAALVWSLPPDKAHFLHALPEADFLRRLQTEFGYRLGRFVKAGQRTVYPLRQVTMANQVHGSVVFIGNAAHTLHPVAGQGFNLGLRDVALLAQCFMNGGLHAHTLLDYQRLRAPDQQAIMHLTNGLIDVFSNRIPGISHLASIGLLAFDQLPALKIWLSRYASGFGGVVPDMVCGMPIRRTDEQPL